jgi:hypothetical protein
MNALSVSVNRHQSATAWATNSGPLSNRTYTGAPPRAATS